MPSQRTTLPLQKVYTKSEFEQITAGLIPECMEDKWFIYYENPWLYLHRSWTGFCIYQVRFETIKEDPIATEAILNRDPSQWKETNDRKDLLLLETLLDSRADCNIAQKLQDWIAIKEN
ncbi:MAG: hypothetical protein QNJ38_19540 [Prochloraceae cyanobacterium]|nr:hypothetical protein [Prochloraceae cyanobacterium]